MPQPAITVSQVVLVTRDPQQAMQWRAQLTAGHQHEVVAITNSARAARGLLAQHRPRIVVCDLRLLDGSAMAMVQSLASEPDAQRPCIVVVAPNDNDPLLLEALRAGADNYYVPATNSESLVDCVRKTLRGESLITGPVARALLDHFDRHARQGGDWKPIDEVQSPLRLSPHERDLLVRLAAGADLELLAERRGVRPSALGTLARSIYRKMLWDLRAGSLSLQLA
jgi:DNA-binding NarL/FixJ family response regulator